MDSTHESEPIEELKVGFFPELFLQRRIWILDILRRENISQILEVGCGEGQLLATLCRPAPWLPAPPPEILTPMSSPTSSPNPDEPPPPSPSYNDDDMPNLHIREVHGLDISSEDLKFAVENITPPVDMPEVGSPGVRSYVTGLQRWEELLAKVWKGGLEVINEEFVGMECIVSTEVIEHLPENILSAFTPMLLGVYHPKYFLVTTPSYTFNARFTAPDAPPSARRGYPDPTGRTDRIFRHDDHKFEWTREEFKAWCQTTAEEWGYAMEETSIGRAVDPDPYGRDEELEGASSAVFFRRLDTMDNGAREAKARAIISQLGIPQEPHTVLAVYQHGVNPAAMKPRPLEEIAATVKAKMEEYREVFMRVESLWYETEIAVQCGGWIEVMVRAIEQSPDLNLKRESDGLTQRTSNWSVELVGGVAFDPWDPSNRVDYIPPDWTPGEGPYEAWADDSDMEEGSTGADGDVSTYTSDADADTDTDDDDETNVGWGKRPRWKTLMKESEGDILAGNGWDRSKEWGDDSGWGHPGSSAGWD
ncbi:hypothetical protein BDN70DRAFT_51059 [Pholiota conissans]|uniref:Small RNA 2'-O-methyltransferase n=1 Tax=Pholiota conissans TaxID=109636 RepID=A0A9P6CSL0_9AGAR|nr:hypothetical protein BDN70DRAFT_51059 [Pholiota conissans]